VSRGVTGIDPYLGLLEQELQNLHRIRIVSVNAHDTPLQDRFTVIVKVVGSPSQIPPVNICSTFVHQISDRLEKVAVYCFLKSQVDRNPSLVDSPYNPTKIVPYTRFV